MAVGFPPLSTDTFSYQRFTKPQFLVLLVRAIQQVGWSVEIASKEGIAARTAPTVRNPGQRIVFHLEENDINVFSYSLGNNPNDRGINNQNILNLKEVLTQLVKYADLEKLNLAFLSLKEHLHEGKHPLFKVPDTPRKQVEIAFANFAHSKYVSVTYDIIAINILIYLAMVFSGLDFLTPDPLKLIDWGANIRSQTLDGQWWRLVSCTFLHYGLMHVGMNMWVLSDIGLFVEKIVGRWQFIGAYLLAGIAGSMTSLWWHEQVVGVGASGAIFGLFGVFLALNATGHIDRALQQNLQRKILFFIMISLGIGWIVPQFDNAGHIGGLLGGILTGGFMLPKLLRKGPQFIRKYPIPLASLVIIPAVVFGLAFTSNWQVDYDKLINNFSENEKAAMEYFGFTEETAPEAKTAFLENTGIPAWEENESLASEISDLYGLPPNYITRSELLKQYAQLRKQQFEKLLQSIAAKNTALNNELARINKDIRDILIRMDPEDPSNLLKRAEDRMKQGDYNGALEDANTLIAMMPNRSELYDFRARIYRRLQRFDAAVKEYETVVSRGGATADTYIDKGFCLARLGKHNEAIQAYDRALAISPANAIAFNYRGWSNFQQNNNEQALKDYRKALQIFPELSTTLSNLGLLKYYMGEKDSANLYLNKAIAIDPKLDFPHQVLGRFENGKGNNPAALVHYNNAIASDPGNANNYYLRAITLLNLGKIEALEDIERAMKLNPHDADNYRVLADIQHQLFGDDKVALVNYSEAINMQPNDKFLYVARSNFYLDLKAYEKALEDYAAVTEIDSSFSTAWGNSGWIKYLQGNYEECISYSQKAIEIDSNAFYAMYNWALAELNLGNTETAKALYLDFKAKDLAQDGEINSGAISDLKDMIKDKRKPEAAAQILEEVFEEEVVLP